MSCIFTLTHDLDAEFPAVAARRMGLSRVPLLCAQEIGVPGAMPSVIRVLIHAYARRPPRPGARLPRRDARRCAWTCTARSRLRKPCRSSSPSGSAASPSIPPPTATRCAERRRAAGLQRVALPAAPRGRRGGQRASLGGLNRYPDPTSSRAARGAERPLRRARRTGSRSATARATSCSPPARRCSSRAPRSSTRGRRFSVYPHLAAAVGRARDHGAGRRRAPPRPRRDAAGDHRRHAAGDRLQPEQPDVDRAAARARSPAFVARGPAPRRASILDEAYCEFNLLDDPDASLDLLARPPEPRPAAHVLQGLRPVRAARRLRAVRLGGVPRGGRPGAPAVLLQRRRPGRRRSRRCSHQDEVAAASSATSPSGSSSRTGCARLGIAPAESQANFVWFDLPGRTPSEAGRSSRGARATRGVLVRAGRRARPRGRAARHRRHAGRERAVPRRARRRLLAALNCWYDWPQYARWPLEHRTRAAPSPRPPAVLRVRLSYRTWRFS